MSVCMIYGCTFKWLLLWILFHSHFFNNFSGIRLNRLYFKNPFHKIHHEFYFKCQYDFNTVLKVYVVSLPLMALVNYLNKYSGTPSQWQRRNCKLLSVYIAYGLCQILEIPQWLGKHWLWPLRLQLVFTFVSCGMSWGSNS